MTTDNAAPILLGHLYGGRSLPKFCPLVCGSSLWNVGIADDHRFRNRPMTRSGLRLCENQATNSTCIKVDQKRASYINLDAFDSRNSCQIDARGSSLQTARRFHTPSTLSGRSQVSACKRHRSLGVVGAESVFVTRQPFRLTRLAAIATPHRKARVATNEEFEK